MSRLEEIKSEVSNLSMIEDVSYAMLPEDIEELQVIRLDSIKWLISRVEELEERNYRYRRRLKNIRLMCASEDAYDRETIPSIHEEATKAIRGDWGETE